MIFFKDIMVGCCFIELFEAKQEKVDIILGNIEIFISKKFTRDPWTFFSVYCK